MAKEVIGFIKLQVPAGGANPSPPIGPALGQKGLNIMDFCKQFNAKTQGMEKNMPIPVVITAFSDRSFTFVTKTPPNSFFIMKHAKIEKGSGSTGLNQAGTITMDQVREIAKIKMPDLNCHTIKSAMQQIIGTARSMGVAVKE